MKSPHLVDGSDWMEHEDCIVGDEQGLKNLIVACESAIKDGECFENGLGDYVGVKKLDSSFFIETEDPKGTKTVFTIVFIIVIFLL
ncbi:MAG: hypothetical protein JKX81_12315, partial [Arenicella sp.]|nr:hypothetical protein [Arenicella sp.]